MNDIIIYVQWLSEKHRAIRDKLKQEGKTYRSHTVSFETGYISACTDIIGNLQIPQKNAELQEAMAKFAQRFKV